MLKVYPNLDNIKAQAHINPSEIWIIQGSISPSSFHVVFYL
jgi:hypothetical protein